MSVETVQADIVIIGAGPAGASAANFMARAGQRTILLDNSQSGTHHAWVANHYGIIGMTGYDLFETGKLQAQRSGAQLEVAAVEALEVTGEGFIIRTEQTVYCAPRVLLATGRAYQLAEYAGVELVSDNNGNMIINTDAEGRTNVPGIRAAGVCTGLSMHVSVTSGHGAHVAVTWLGDITGRSYQDHDNMC